MGSKNVKSEKISLRDFIKRFEGFQRKYDLITDTVGEERRIFRATKEDPKNVGAYIVFERVDGYTLIVGETRYTYFAEVQGFKTRGGLGATFWGQEVLGDIYNHLSLGRAR